MSARLEEQVSSAYRRTIIIIASIGLSILFLLVFNFYLGTTLVAQSEADFGLLRISFTVIVLFLGLGAIALRRYMFGAMKLQTVQAGRGVEGLLEHLSRISIILAVLAESAAVLGVIFGIMTGDQGHATSLILVGLVILIVSYPRRRSWFKAAAAVEAS